MRQDDALFGLGTYKYMADTLPSFIKGLRALLFIPKGNRAGSLEQLRKAAESSRTFGFEARVLLITIYAHKHERRTTSLAERDRLLAAAPDGSPRVCRGAARPLPLPQPLRDRLGHQGARARGDAERRRSGVLRSLDLLRARAELADLRPDLAAATARRAIDARQGLGVGIKRDLESILRASREYAQGIEWARVAESDAAALTALAEAAPNDPRLALIAGDAQLRAGKASEASALLERAEGAGSRGGGSAAACCGRDRRRTWAGTARARSRVQAASETTGFPGKDAAYYHQAVPYRPAREPSLLGAIAGLVVVAIAASWGSRGGARAPELSSRAWTGTSPPRGSGGAPRPRDEPRLRDVLPPPPALRGARAAARGESRSSSIHARRRAPTRR